MRMTRNATIGFFSALLIMFHVGCAAQAQTATTPPATQQAKQGRVGAGSTTEAGGKLSIKESSICGEPQTLLHIIRCVIQPPGQGR